MVNSEGRKLFIREFTKHLILNSKSQIRTIRKPSYEYNQLPGIIPSSIKIITKEIAPEIRPVVQIQPPRSVPFQRVRNIKTSPIVQEITLQAPTPSNFNLGKLNMLTADPKVSVVECPGPDKLILANIYGKAIPTKISLNEAEIKNIIQQFSNASKIPIIGGLFKVAVGNLIMTAVISDLVGSRFVITKIIPQSQQFPTRT